MIRGECDLAVGQRVAHGGAWPSHARVANRMLAAAVWRRTGLHLADLGPMRAAHRLDLFALELRDRRSAWPLEMVLCAHDVGWRIRNVPVEYRERQGRSKVTDTVRGTWRAVGDMSRLLDARRR